MIYYRGRTIREGRGKDNQFVLEQILGYDQDRITELVVAGALE